MSENKSFLSILLKKTMALSSSNNKFTFIWKLKNYSMLVVENEESLDSPPIFVELLDRTEWCLSLCPKDEEDNLSCSLTRNKSKQSPESVQIDCSMTLLSVDNLLNITRTIYSCAFEENDSKEFVFGNVDEIFVKLHVRLPSDILIIRCSIWRTDCNVNPIIPTNKEVAVEDSKTTGKKICPKEESISDQTAAIKKNLIELVYVGSADTLYSRLSEKMYLNAKKNLEDLKIHLLPNECTIRTQISCERRWKIWEIKKFNEIQTKEIIFTSVVSAVANAPSFVLALYLLKDVDGNDDIHIDIQINHDGKYRYVVKCTITILNALYEDQDCIQDKHLFNGKKNSWRLPLIKKSKCKDQYLKKGSLLLRCELIISEEDNVSTVEETVSFPSVQDTTDERELNDWKMGLLRTRKEGDFSDVVLEVGKQDFRAHKAILSASSPFFKDLLDDDFDEQTVYIKDCEPEILDKLLEYMYSGVLVDMAIECVMKLYSVAKTYKVVALERQCSYRLRSSLDVSNVSEVLLFAGLRQDEVLKMAAMKFISVFPDEVFHSLSWKKFMENNAKISGEAMYYVLTRNFVH